MRILMKTTAADPDKVLAAGSIYTMDNHEAEQLVAGGYAVEVPEDVQVVDAPEVPLEAPAQAAPARPARSSGGRKPKQEA